MSELERAVGRKTVSLHTMDVTLEHVHKTESILIGHTIGTAELDNGTKLEIIGSGSTIRFLLSGSDGYVDMNIASVAARVTAILRDNL